MCDEWWRLPVMFGGRLVSQGVVRPTLTGHKLNSEIPFQNAFPALSSSLRVVSCRPATAPSPASLPSSLAASWSWTRSLSCKCAQIEIPLHQWGSLCGYAALFSPVSMKEMSEVLPRCTIQDFPFCSDKQPGEMARAGSLSRLFS